MRPVAIIAFSFGGNSRSSCGPKPAVNDVRRQIGTITAVEIAFAAAGPNVSEDVLT